MSTSLRPRVDSCLPLASAVTKGELFDQEWLAGGDWRECRRPATSAITRRGRLGSPRAKAPLGIQLIPSSPIGHPLTLAPSHLYLAAMSQAVPGRVPYHCAYHSHQLGKAQLSLAE